MAYRGEDLDLRTPQGWGPGREPQGDWPQRGGSYKGGRPDPIWIDENVMACCNHAFDLAVAHRAPEVRLEHLINAMTLNDAIVPLLEARGIGVASLRRESGAILASEVPAAPAGGKINPKRSEALEEALRLAAERAYPRRTPVTIDDILHVLFDMKRELPGITLLRRHSGSTWSGRNGADQPRAEARPDFRQELRPELRLEPLPHLARSYPSEPRYPAQDYFPQRPRETAPPDYYPPQQQPPAMDALQNNRLDALDRAVRDLGLDLSADRKSLQQVVSELQRNQSMTTDDTNRFRGGLTDRLNQLEDSLVRARTEQPPVAAALMERMAGIERAIETRLAEMSRAQPGSTALADRLNGLERLIEQRIGDIAHAWNVVSERLQSVELAAGRSTEVVLPVSLQSRLDGLGTMERRLEGLAQLERKLDNVERTFSVMLDRLTGVERKLSETKTVDLAPLEARLASLERNIVDGISRNLDLSPVTDLLSGMETRVAGLERSIENRSAETGRTVSFIGERLRAFEETMLGLKTQSSDRIGQVEQLVSGYATRVTEATASHDRDLVELHEALVKLNANQSALDANQSALQGSQKELTSALEQWRLDSTGDLSVVSNRLKSIEDHAQRREPVVEALASQVAAIHSAVAKREQHKSRFGHWLFGTDQWYAASYDTERWRARQTAEAAPRNGLEIRGPITPQPQRASPPPTIARR